MKLYTFAVAPNPARVHFFLNEKVKGSEVAIDVQEVTVNFLTSEQKQPEFLAKNPAGTLPVLELDDGTCLLESLPIMEYLEELYPEPSLIGRSPLERARIRGVERKIEMSILLRVIRAVHATRSPLGLPANPALAENELQRLPGALAQINEHIGDSEFVMGEAPSIADCTLLAAMNFANFGELEIAAEHEHLHRWFASYALRHLQ